MIVGLVRFTSATADHRANRGRAFRVEMCELCAVGHPFSSVLYLSVWVDLLVCKRAKITEFTTRFR